MPLFFMNRPARLAPDPAALVKDPAADPGVTELERPQQLDHRRTVEFVRRFPAGKLAKRAAKAQKKAAKKAKKSRKLASN